MGIKTKWVVVKGTPKSEVLDALGVVETGLSEGDDIAPIAAADLGNGWIAVHWGDFAEWQPERVAAWFPRGEVLFGSIHDTVSFNIARGMRDGEAIWSVKSFPDEDEAIQTEGSLPPEFETVKSGLQRQQGEDPEDCYLGDLPTDLVRAISGYDPSRSYDGGPDFQVVEPRRSGADGARQSARLALMRKLAEAVRSDIYSAAGALGFGPVAADSGHRRIGPSERTLVRHRDGWVEELVFQPGYFRGSAAVGILFFAQRAGELRGGRPGYAVVPPPRRSFLEMFIGRKEEPEGAVLDRAVRGAKDLLPLLDQHLREGTPHPHVRPADYLEPRGKSAQDPEA